VGAFDPEHHQSAFDRLKATFTEEFFKAWKNWGNQSEVPVFVIGMPRSGTTLVEQIISAHSNADGAGERSDIPAFIRNFNQASGGEDSFPDNIQNLTEVQIGEWAEDYLDKFENLDSAARIVDKLPFNYAHL
jgi:hypothetical protein